MRALAGGYGEGSERGTRAQQQTAACAFPIVRKSAAASPAINARSRRPRP